MSLTQYLNPPCYLNFKINLYKLGLFALNVTFGFLSHEFLNETQ